LLRLPAVKDNAAMQTEPPEAEPPKRKRRWFQFSLLSLLIFTMACAVGAAWVAREMERKRIRALEEKAHEELRAMVKPVANMPYRVTRP
jgi:hypothetical protein